MNKHIILNYVSILLFFIITTYLTVHQKNTTQNLDEFSVAKRSFGTWFQVTSLLNTWLSGAMFIAFAGFASQHGFISYYVVTYSLLSLLLMFFISKRVFIWGKQFKLKTQANFLGMRYQSKKVQTLFSIIAVISVFPWLILGLQSIGLVFYYLSFQTISLNTAILMGVTILCIRQAWTIRYGIRGVILSDMLQSIIAYGIGSIISLYFIIWLNQKGFSLISLNDDLFQLTGINKQFGSLYYPSIIITGALGAWCWPEIFTRLFTSNSIKTIQRTASIAAPIMFVFIMLLITMAIIAGQIDEIKSKPDHVWFIITAYKGPFMLLIASICVLAATVGNINALSSSIGITISNDIININSNNEQKTTIIAKKTIFAVTILAGICSIFTIKQTSNLLILAISAYQGIVQLAPSLYLGIFWSKGNATSAIVATTIGFIIAVFLQLQYPNGIVYLKGMTSGMVALTINTCIYALLAYNIPKTKQEQKYINTIFSKVNS